jgi:hypothetical protein
MKKILTNRIFLLIFGLLIGAYIGGELTLKFVNAQQIEYDEMLHEHFVKSRIWDIATALFNLKHAENQRWDDLISGNEMLLRGAFVTLVEIHKTGDYSRKNAEMVRSLKRAKNFMLERPDKFLEIKFVALPKNGSFQLENESFENDPITNPFRTQLQEAFDYVKDLQEHE